MATSQGRLVASTHAQEAEQNGMEVCWGLLRSCFDLRDCVSHSVFIGQIISRCVCVSVCVCMCVHIYVQVCGYMSDPVYIHVCAHMCVFPSIPPCFPPFSLPVFYFVFKCWGINIEAG